MSAKLIILLDGVSASFIFFFQKCLGSANLLSTILSQKKNLYPVLWIKIISGITSSTSRKTIEIKWLYNPPCFLLSGYHGHVWNNDYLPPDWKFPTVCGDFKKHTPTNSDDPASSSTQVDAPTSTHYTDEKWPSQLLRDRYRPICKCVWGMGCGGSRITEFLIGSTWTTYHSLPLPSFLMWWSYLRWWKKSVRPSVLFQIRQTRRRETIKCNRRRGREKGING